MPKRTTQQQCIEKTSNLYLAFELSNKKWKLGFSIGLGQKVRIRSIDAGDLAALKREIEAAKKRFHLLAGKVQVTSCFEAGRDGFWIHRFLVAEGIQNLVVDSSSIEVNRRKRRVKADKLDVNSLARMLIRYSLGEKKIWSTVRVPSVEDEDGRQLHRSLSTMEKERKRCNNRIRGLLATQGIRIKGKVDLSDGGLETLRTWDGQRLGRGLMDRIGREWAHLIFIKEQISGIVDERFPW
jgi:transposase